MPRLDENQRLRAIGMLQAGLAQNVVARHFDCHRNTILSLWRRLRQSGNTRNHRRSGRPRVTSRRQDNHIRLVHLRNRFQTSNLTARSIPGLRPISSRTVRNRLREHNIRPRLPSIRPILLPRHRAARLTWCRRYLRFRITGDGHLRFFTCKWDRHLHFKLSGHLRFQIWHTCVKTDGSLRFLPVPLILRVIRLKGNILTGNICRS